MGYIIRPRPDAKKRPWACYYQDRTAGRNKWKYVKESDFLRLGFRSDMTLTEAQARRDQLNASEELKRQEAKRATISERLETEDLTYLAFLPAADVEAFETEVLYLNVDAETLRRNKVESHWRAARKCICSLKLEPMDWEHKAAQFYAYFRNQKWSPSYVQKVLPIINQWGNFVSYRRKSYFKPIPFPTGADRGRISDAYYRKRKHGMKSDVLTPTELESKRSVLDPETYRWLRLAVWFGLRPEEIDSLSRQEHFEITTVNGVRVLRIYQTKIISVPEDERWKFIPAHHPEQVRALESLEANEPFSTPCGKTLKKHFGPRIYLYAGRKGFMDLMLDQGHAIEDISTWMGHQSVDRTWRSYRNRLTMRVRPRTE